MTDGHEIASALTRLREKQELLEDVLAENSYLLDGVRHRMPLSERALGVAGAGTHEDRLTAGNQFTTSRGVDQIYGAINTTQKLLGGQLEGRERQLLKG